MIYDRSDCSQGLFVFCMQGDTYICRGVVYTKQEDIFIEKLCIGAFYFILAALLTSSHVYTNNKLIYNWRVTGLMENSSKRHNDPNLLM